MKLRFCVLLATVAVLVMPACVVFTFGGEGEGNSPSPSPPDSQDRDPSPSLGGGSFAVTGSGRVKVEQRAVRGFDRVSIGGTGELFLEQAGEESLTIEAEDNLLPLLTSDVQGGRLSLGVRPNTTISATRPIVYRLKVRSLKELRASGAVKVSATGIDQPELNVNLSGSVSSTFAGRASSQDISLSGTGRFDGRSLEGREASVEISGTGEAIVNAAEALNVRGSGTARVRFLGNPRVEQQVSGLARVERLQ